jgi:hypothetical protein
VLNQRGEEYLSRIPAASHRALARVRAFHLRATRTVLRNLEDQGKRRHADPVSFDCQ